MISPESYPNIACTLFMQSIPSTVNICPSPPLRRSSSSKLSMASLICNCNNTKAGVSNGLAGAVELLWMLKKNPVHQRKALMHDKGQKKLCGHFCRKHMAENNFWSLGVPVTLEILTFCLHNDGNHSEPV